MPSKIFHTALRAEKFSIARTTTETVDFKSSCSNIISRMMKQGGTISRMKQCVHKSMEEILNFLDLFHLYVLSF